MIIIRQPRARSAGLGRTGEAVRLLVCCLLFIGVLARGLIPAGYMPERDVHSGDISVAMCSGAGEMQTIHLGPTEAPPKGKTVGQHCPFAGLSASLLPQPRPGVEAPVSVARADRPRSQRVIFRPQAAWSANAPPTGPPQSA